MAVLPERQGQGIGKQLLNGLKCSPTCPGGHTFVMEVVEYKKCKKMAFLHSLTEENYDVIKETDKIRIK